ncbi:tryptophan--tRNA ligase [Methanococcus maripaludis]|uniref:Tryptophan--tRNA ligase n=1 Tax=Methanococcus maripaludis TaxID=39152 RepID=A0A7J9S1C7_METMI|nr:tryptophan--tRNA ligase [Methanococcus maripaludis]MBB6067347.1 tryptophanyl-tRNA synthetase [Methanococcus maripaludis]
MITPWDVSDDLDYKKTMEQFGVNPISEIVKTLKEPHNFMKRGIVFGHRDFQKIADAMNNGKDFTVVSGMMPSGKMHFGHKMVVDQLLYYQKYGADIYIPIADLEAYWARGMDFETTKKLAIEEYITNYIALGLDPEKIHVYLQSKNETVKDLAMRLSKRVNFTEMKGIYGFSGETNIGHVFAPVVQVADILHPQLEKKVPVVVPVGIDQDPHIRLTRDIAGRYKDFKFIAPSSTYHRFITGLLGGKMSSSKPETAIYLSDEPTKSFKKKVMSCKTGGRETLEEQKKLGGIPEECVVYELYTYHLIEDDKELKQLYEQCKSGELTCGTCKKECYQKLVEFMTDLQEKREQAKEVAAKLL